MRKDMNRIRHIQDAKMHTAVWDGAVEEDANIAKYSDWCRQNVTLDPATSLRGRDKEAFIRWREAFRAQLRAKGRVWALSLIHI